VHSLIIIIIEISTGNTKRPNTPNVQTCRMARDLLDSATANLYGTMACRVVGFNMT